MAYTKRKLSLTDCNKRQAEWRGTVLKFMAVLNLKDWLLFSTAALRRLTKAKMKPNFCLNYLANSHKVFYWTKIRDPFFISYLFFTSQTCTNFSSNQVRHYLGHFGPFCCTCKNITEFKNTTPDLKGQVTSDRTSEQVCIPGMAQSVEGLRQRSNVDLSCFSLLITCHIKITIWCLNT